MTNNLLNYREKLEELSAFGKYGGEHTKVSGKERLKRFLQKEVGEDNDFYTEDFMHYSLKLFGLQPASLHATFNALLKEGIVEHIAVKPVFNPATGRRICYKWWVN
ncbi:hypothetical protein CF160_11320 [Enterococcus pseudoavium]|nr:hypothetical protein CF160_11320 [Enterococcus pseudoavium]